MTVNPLEPEVITFIRELCIHNNKDWFDENRAHYTSSIRPAIINFTQEVINLFNEQGENISIDPRKCIFRINRDIRFSKDKSPYKDHFGVVISQGGTKQYSDPGMYIEIGPEFFKIYGGVYKLSKEELYTLRESIDTDLKDFQKAVTNKAFVELFDTVSGEKNKVIPKEFKATGEKEPLIYNKNMYVFHKLPAEQILENNLEQVILDHYKALKPFTSFLRNVLKKVE